tara:strand:+ start:174 stop:335 length:162 start_codon:yes stop_codon:yes gene_type:complete
MIVCEHEDTSEGMKFTVILEEEDEINALDNIIGASSRNNEEALAEVITLGLGL